MLQFDDACLARVIRATTALRPYARATLLKDLANALDPKPSPSKGAVKARRKRLRERQRRGCYLVEIDQRDLETLLDAGQLSEAEAQDRAAIGRELSMRVAQWAQRWRDQEAEENNSSPVAPDRS